MDCSPPGSSVHGVSQARILEWVDIPYSRGSKPRIKPVSPASPALTGGFFITMFPGSPVYSYNGILFSLKQEENTDMDCNVETS